VLTRVLNFVYNAFDTTLAELPELGSLTVTIPIGSGLPKGKNFTCNVFIISTHFSPLEW